MLKSESLLDELLPGCRPRVESESPEPRRPFTSTWWLMCAARSTLSFLARGISCSDRVATGPLAPSFAATATSFSANPEVAARTDLPGGVLPVVPARQALVSVRTRQPTSTTSSACDAWGEPASRPVPVWARRATTAATPTTSARATRGIMAGCESLPDQRRPPRRLPALRFEYHFDESIFLSPNVVQAAGASSSRTRCV